MRLAMSYSRDHTGCPTEVLKNYTGFYSLIYSPYTGNLWRRQPGRDTNEKDEKGDGKIDKNFGRNGKGLYQTDQLTLLFVWLSLFVSLQVGVSTT
jgi:hypothetical protein